MPKIIFMTDFTEKYANSLLKGIIDYSVGKEPWIICKVPLSFREDRNLAMVLNWSIKWKADAIIGQFYDGEDLNLFKNNNIIVLAQDFQHRFNNVHNITGFYKETGIKAADYFLERGFNNFAFYGYKNIVWSDERCEGYKYRLRVKNKLENYFEFYNKSAEPFWTYDYDNLSEWITKLPKPIAIFTCDDNQGRIILEVCNICNINIPQEVSVLGVDNDEFTCSLSYPHLSSINQKVEEGGYNAAKLIDKLLKKEQVNNRDIFISPGDIITRASTDTYASTDINIKKIISYIHKHQEEKINIDTLVKLIPLSRRLLEIKFKKETNQSIYSYLLNLKINKLIDYLINTDLTIAEIVYKIGYDDPRNLSRLFKSKIGMTPTKYRNIYKKNSSKITKS